MRILVLSIHFQAHFSRSFLGISFGNKHIGLVRPHAFLTFGISGSVVMARQPPAGEGLAIYKFIRYIWHYI
jgi:hypothetical protein